MAIKSLRELPKGKRASQPQVERAKKAKAIQVPRKIIGKRYGRTEVSLGIHTKDNVIGVVKGFRQKLKVDFGVILKDKQGDVIARTHLAKGISTIPEQLVARAIAKYAKSYNEIRIVASVLSQRKRKKK